MIVGAGFADASFLGEILARIEEREERRDLAVSCDG